MNNDRTMGGPTSEMWFDPWIAHLTSLGVTLHAGATVDSIQMAGNAISGITLSGGGTLTADYYVLAVPLDGVTQMITAQMAAADPALARLKASNVDDLVSWMVGIQYFLYEDVPLVAWPHLLSGLAVGAHDDQSAAVLARPRSLPQDLR